jgi:hypothetical protein
VPVHRRRDLELRVRLRWSAQAIPNVALLGLADAQADELVGVGRLRRMTAAERKRFGWAFRTGQPQVFELDEDRFGAAPLSDGRAAPALVPRRRVVCRGGPSRGARDGTMRS